MSFLKGTVTVRRFSTPIAKNWSSGQWDIDLLVNNNADKCELSEDTPQHGWAGGLHELDMEFSCEKCLRGDYLVWGFRVTEDKLPESRIKALAELEVSGAKKDGRKLAWDDAMESATATVQEEAKDGRYRKHTLIQVVWDRAESEVWYGSSSDKYVTLFQECFERTFGVALYRVHPLIGAGGDNIYEPVWDKDGEQFVGNEFMMWMLHKTSKGQHDFNGKLAFVTSSVHMACPRGEKGRDVFTHEMPTKMPEFESAVKEGKVARKIGLTIGDDGYVYSLTFNGEEYVVSGAKLPEDEDAKEPAIAELERLDHCRKMFNTIDYLADRFLDDDTYTETLTQWRKVVAT